MIQLGHNKTARFGTIVWGLNKSPTPFTFEIKMSFTQFWDMNSGGGQKESFKYCYIEAPQAEAKVIFYNRFGHNPERVTCTCCGEDYSINESETLEQATGYHRGCKSINIGMHKWEYQEIHCGESYRPYVELADYLNQADIMVIRADEITDADRLGDVPSQGFVWVD
jgi:hypothetical protein